MANKQCGLECHFKLPHSITKELVNNNDRDDFVFVYNREKLPVVILIGWAGCVDKSLAKYSAIYEERGKFNHGLILHRCMTLRCMVSPSVMFLRQDKFPKLAKRIVDKIHEMSLDEHPIFFHVFSNGGTFFYQHISSQMQEDERKLQVRGVIFDSAPGDTSMFSLFMNMIKITGGPTWVNTPGSFFITLLLFFALTFFAYLTRFIVGGKRQTDLIILEDEPITWPQMFIYSKKDLLAFYKNIEKFAINREKKGVQVKMVSLGMSCHINHLKYHREIYISTVINFVQDSLNENKSVK